MFDMGFWELFVIMVIALLVVGPERLPGLARKTGLWIRKVRGFITSVKDDIDRELAAEELKKIVKEHAESSGVHEIIEEAKSTVAQAKQDYLLDAVDDEENKIMPDLSKWDNDNSDGSNNKDKLESDGNKDKPGLAKDSSSSSASNDTSVKDPNKHVTTK